jgi:hypothetical protein
VGGFCGRLEVVGKPRSQLLLRLSCQVFDDFNGKTECHSHYEDGHKPVLGNSKPLLYCHSQQQQAPKGVKNEYTPSGTAESHAQCNVGHGVAVHPLDVGLAFGFSKPIVPNTTTRLAKLATLQVLGLSASVVGCDGMSKTKLTVLVSAALVFAVYETGVAYARPDVPNFIWAGFGWLCVLFVVGLFWESRIKK